VNPLGGNQGMKRSGGAEWPVRAGVVPNGSLNGMRPRENTARTIKCQKVNGQPSPGNARPRDFGAQINTFAHKHTHIMHIKRLWLAGWRIGVEVTESSTNKQHSLHHH
jgi:hypothetical protein